MRVFSLNMAHINNLTSQSKFGNKDSHGEKEKKSSLAQYFCKVAAIIRLACFILTFSGLRMLFRAGHGLLVLAD